MSNIVYIDFDLCEYRVLVWVNGTTSVPSYKALLKEKKHGN